VDDLVVDISKVPEEQHEDLEIDLKLFKFNITLGKENEHETLFKKVPFGKWKKYMMNEYDDSNIIYLDSSTDSVGRQVDLKGYDLLDSQMFDKTSKELIPCKTYMRFKVMPRSSSSSDPVNISTNYPKVRDSFKHELTISGIETLGRLKSTILSRYVDWSSRKKEYIAPIVSLCQSSGSGKTKMSIELIKRNPGFYLVFRQAEQTGYPRTNPLSRELYSIISAYNDSSSSLMDNYYMNCTIGNILDFIVRIVSSYITAIVAKSRSLITSTDISINEAVLRSVAEFGILFQDNESLTARFEVLSRDKMHSIYCQDMEKKDRGSGALTVSSISRFFSKILQSPEYCLIEPADSTTKSICENIATKLKSYPFLFILDEADLLNNLSFKQKDMDRIVTGFEVLRRALGYLETSAKIIFLTLGTKSDIVDINPPVIDMSSRFMKRDSILEPIALTSNSNIFSKEFSITKMKSVSYNLLRNPLMFKYLVTMGHGLWGSFPFLNVVNSANMKLTNGSAATKGYFLPVWMIRIGLSASPFHIDSRSLIANHMATLFNIESGFKTMTVSYPSEPVLALSARSLTDANRDEALFSVLKSKTEAIAIDKGRFGEIFVAMIVLRAVDDAPNFSLPADASSLKEINEMVPEFKSLWEKKIHLLEPEKDISSGDMGSTAINEDFPDYKVCRVADFISSLTGLDMNTIIKKFPSKILEGIVNATHMVNLYRDKDGFNVSSEVKFEPRDLPSADTRIADNSRNVIDGVLLKNGLLRQCAFFLPSNYYGLDIIIPVCLKSGKMTYIGVKVKASEANFSDDVYKMQNRLHFVKCAHCQKFSETSTSCPQCTTDIDGLKEIYYNSVTLLMSLAEDGTFTPFYSKISQNLQPKHEKDLENLKTALKPNFNGEEVPLKGKGMSFLKPLLQIVEPLNKDNLAIIKSIWIDKCVKKSEDSDKGLIIDDKFIHRQFCISTRGWKIFNRLFPEAEKSFKIANEILQSEGLFRDTKNRNSPQIIRNVLHDSSPNYLQYTDELWLQRGNFESNSDKLDKFENDMKIKSKLIEIETENESESEQIQIPTPPHSP
jgi:hypothetical protein